MGARLAAEHLFVKGRGAHAEADKDLVVMEAVIIFRTRCEVTIFQKKAAPKKKVKITMKKSKI